jgi:hypothetical protein
MKNAILILLSPLILSCSKETVEKPVEPISMTQTRLVYDAKNAYVETLNVIHFHKVTDTAIIQQYKALPVMQPFCDDMNDTLLTVIGKPCETDCTIKK